MKKLDFYEFVGILVPGGVFVTGLLLIYPDATPFRASDGVTFGEFGLLLLLAYAFGHLVQSVGNFIEWIWWIAWRGMPTDWVSQKRKPRPNQRITGKDIA